MLSRLAAILWVAALSFAPVGVALAQSTSQGQALIDKASPSIVTVQVVLKIQMKAGGQSRSSESKLSTEGVVVTPDGVVMMSNAPISSEVWNQMMGGDGEDKENLSITPSEFKVVIGSEQKEYSAFLAATDPKLGLAFIKIEDLGDRKLTPVDFTNPGAINIGDQLAAVTRLSKGYDYAPLVSQGQVRGVTAKPRSAYVLTSQIASIGLPVFTMDGTQVGVMVLMSASVNADTSEMMMRFFAGSITDRMGIFLIPAATVQPIITEAIAQATKLAADRAKNPPAKPSTPAAPATSTKADTQTNTTK